MIVKGNIIYYTNGTEIYSCNTDGSGKTTLLGSINRQIDFFELQSGYAFLKTTGGNNQNQELSVINLKTLNRRKLHEGTYITVLTDNQWFYFIDSTKDCNIFKMKFNGTGLVKLTDQLVNCFNIDRNRIYYISDSSTYSIDTNGKDKQDLKTLVLNSYLHTFDNKLYYFSISGLEAKNLK
jgi:hypothetical protein